MDPSICFSRDPKALRAQVGAWLVKEELVVGQFMTPEFWCWPVVSRVMHDQLGIHQHTGHRLRLNRTVMNVLGSQLCTTSLVECLSLMGVRCR